MTRGLHLCPGCPRALFSSLSLSLAAGLEELVLSEISSPSRSQPAGDSSSISSFSYKDMMKEPPTTTQSKVSQAYSSAALSLLYHALCLTFLPSLKFSLLFLASPACSRQRLLIERLFIEQTASGEVAEGLEASTISVRRLLRGCSAASGAAARRSARSCDRELRPALPST